ncbi:MAG: STAS domain-containing protein [Solirubrobacteraceae bacterium]
MSGIEVEQIDGVPVAHLSSDIDAANAARVREELAGCFERGNDRVVLDLSRIAYLDSAGIDMLFRLSERLYQRRAGLVLVIAAGSQLVRLARIVGLGRAMPVHDTVEEALRALSSDPRGAVSQADS